MVKKRFPIEDVHTIVFDFDGVFTDNFVYVDGNGNEMIRCSRSDSYGITMLKRALRENQVKIDLFVLSTETNSVVTTRCDKMGIHSYTGAKDKLKFLEEWLASHRKDMLFPTEGVVYFGNDLNDLEVISEVGYSFCPGDAHPKIKEKSTYTLDSKGGVGFVREGIEILIGKD